MGFSLQCGSDSYTVCIPSSIKFIRYLDRANNLSLYRHLACILQEARTSLQLKGWLDKDINGHPLLGL
jgi:hypothetical protein